MIPFKSYLSGTQGTMCLAVALVSGLFMASGGTLTVRPQQEKKAPVANEASLKADLKETGGKLVQVLRVGKAEDFLDFCSKNGVIFGIDQPEIAVREMRRQIRQKRGVYCLLFDTNCLQKEKGFESSFSYRQLLSESTEQEIKVGLIQEKSVLRGKCASFSKAAQLKHFRT